MNERGLDSNHSLVEGVGAEQRVEKRDAAPTDMTPYERTPRNDPTYYERPLIKEPVWIWAVPAYFYVGGVGGAAGVFACALDLFGEEQQETVRKLRWVSLAGTTLGALLLTADLGRPERFLNMLRVLRVTSPMSVGSWVLACNGGVSGAAVAAGMLSRRKGDGWSKLARLAGVQSALLGSVQCAYPAVLLSCTAVPIWQQTRYSLPILFTGSAMASLGSLAAAVGVTNPALEQFTRLGKVFELSGLVSVQAEASQEVVRVTAPLKDGFSGKLWKATAALTGASLLLSIWPGKKSKWRKRLSGLCGTAGAIALRFAALEAGKASSRDPRASFQSQRSRASEKRLESEQPTSPGGQRRARDQVRLGAGG